MPVLPHVAKKIHKAVKDGDSEKVGKSSQKQAFSKKQETLGKFKGPRWLPANSSS